MDYGWQLWIELWMQVTTRSGFDETIIFDATYLNTVAYRLIFVTIGSKPHARLLFYPSSERQQVNLNPMWLLAVLCNGNGNEKHAASPHFEAKTIVRDGPWMPMGESRL